MKSKTNPATAAANETKLSSECLFSFTPLWIFNYSDKELGKHRSPRSFVALSMSDSQVEIPHLSNMGAAPVTVHLITLGPAPSLDATQCCTTRTSPRTQTRAHAHTQKIKMNFLATYGAMVTVAAVVWSGKDGLGEEWGGVEAEGEQWKGEEGERKRERKRERLGEREEKLSFPNSSLIF